MITVWAGRRPEICSPGQAGLFWKWTGLAGPGRAAGQNQAGLVYKVKSEKTDKNQNKLGI